MTYTEIGFLILGGMAGGFVNGFAGTGTALFALGFFLTVLDPVTAVTVVASMSFLTGLQGMFIVRREILSNKPRVLRFVIPGLIGVPIGTAFLTVLDATLLRLLVAGLLIVYGVYFGFRKNLPKFERSTPKSDVAVGFLGGILGGLAALSGALPAIWVSMRPWKKQETRAVLQSFNVTILATTVIFAAFNGAFTYHTWLALAVGFTTALISAQFGIFVFRRISDDMFRRTLIFLCLALGSGILIRHFIG